MRQLRPNRLHTGPHGGPDDWHAVGSGDAAVGRGRQAELAGQVAAVALRALGLVVAGDQGLERVLALLADVFVQRHGVGSPWRVSRAGA